MYSGPILPWKCAKEIPSGFRSYLDATNTNPLANPDLLALALSAFGVQQTPDHTLPYQAISEVFLGAGLLSDDQNGVPQAYLNYILFDESFNEVDHGFDRISSAANGNAEKISLSTVPNQSGYLYIYLSNESNWDVNVFFDDLSIEHTHSRIIQSDDYYPFGLAHNQQPLRLFKNKYLYNNKELQTDLGLNLYDYGARFYDPSIARFGTQNRFAEKYYSANPYHYVLNNPINSIDINGDSTILVRYNNYVNQFNTQFQSGLAERM